MSEWGWSRFTSAQPKFYIILILLEIYPDVQANGCALHIIEKWTIGFGGGIRCLSALLVMVSCHM